MVLKLCKRIKRGSGLFEINSLNLNKIPKDLRAFTIVELIIVVVIVSIIAAFAIPSFYKMQLKSKERRMVMNSEAILSATAILLAKNGKNAAVISFPGGGTSSTNLSEINVLLGTRLLMDSNFQHSYALWMGGGLYAIKLMDSSGVVKFTIASHYGGFPLSRTDPCCVAGTESCPTVPTCSDP